MIEWLRSCVWLCLLICAYQSSISSRLSCLFHQNL